MRTRHKIISRHFNFFLIVLIALIFALLSTGCNHSSQSDKYYCPMSCEGDKTYYQAGDCPICGMHLVPVEQPSDSLNSSATKPNTSSLYLFDTEWTNQKGEKMTLESLAGRKVVITMIYTTCKAACPRLVADMKQIVSMVKSKSVQYVLVSIDPLKDGPQELEQFAKLNELNDDQWTLLSGSEEDTRTLSNLLDVKYRRISPLDFSHSNIITLLDEHGAIITQIEGLNADKTPIVDSLNASEMR